MMDTPIEPIPAPVQELRKALAVSDRERAQWKMRAAVEQERAETAEAEVERLRLSMNAIASSLEKRAREIDPFNSVGTAGFGMREVFEEIAKTIMQALSHKGGGDG